MSETPAPQIVFDIETLTIGEVESLEEIAGQPFGEIAEAMQEGSYSAKMLTGIAFIVMHRDDPEVTIDSVRSLKVTELMERFPTEEGEADPKDAAPADRTGV